MKLLERIVGNIKTRRIIHIGADNKVPLCGRQIEPTNYLLIEKDTIPFGKKLCRHCAAQWKEQGHGH